eukprot:CAMPEP_0197825480 /NCGR_PEP_ID=MMETSP1437-20131217/2554_1 /TAXON_ID=49252 ORGANISM="Eucampia antarctica, Strain CCMP1452" /NCGR_SAMPLE_ID=MMETSP1437 /ASSEMBLY_ACC=CAM_ASM_001096 /LENGTH=194 /DNA_ID=CAMNT_0043425487 /DNA_START=49 /DNA_END=633 /DNA_ORIENTATION=-
MKILLLLNILPVLSAWSFVPPNVSRKAIKNELLEVCSDVNRGLTSTFDEDEKILKLFEKLEKLNPTKSPLKSSLVNDTWELQYTTSAAILGKGDYPRVGPILQSIDTTTLSAENTEVVSYFGLKVPRKVTANLIPVNGQLTDVKFERFSVGPIGFDAPDKFRGSLDVTYLDKDMRLTRGDLGNLFVLTRFNAAK